MKNNIQYHRIPVKVASAAMAVFVLFFSLAVPSFAYTDTSLNNILFDEPIPLVSGSSASQIYNNGFVGITTTDGYGISLSCGLSDSYAFCYVSSNIYYVVICHESDDSNFSSSDSKGYAYKKYGTGQFDYTQKAGTLTNARNDVNYYRPDLTISASSISQINIPEFSSLDDGLSAFADFLENPSSGGGSSSHPLSYSLLPGNALVVEVSGLSGTGSLSTTTASAGWSYLSSQCGGTFTSVPNLITYPLSGTHEFSWTGTGTKDLFGRFNNFSTSFSYDGTQSGDNVYYIIVNPVVNDYLSGDGVSTPLIDNNSLSVYMSSVSSFKVVQLGTEYHYGGTQTAEQGGDTGSGTYDPTTDSWVVTNDTTGEPFNQHSGGLNTMPQAGSTINDWLQNIANTISSFFKGAIGAVTTLVSAGSDFIHALTSLYAWLPAPVYAVLSSALILVITIGVIKVFI